MILRAASHVPMLGDTRKEAVAVGSIHSFFERYERSYAGTLSIAGQTGRSAPAIPVRTIRLSTRGLTLRTSRRDGMTDDDLSLIEAAQKGQQIQLQLLFGKKVKKSDVVPTVDLRGDVSFVDRIEYPGCRSVGMRFDSAQWGTDMVQIAAPAVTEPMVVAAGVEAPPTIETLPAKFAEFWSLVRRVAA
jgi:hypothetical protein